MATEMVKETTAKQSMMTRGSNYAAKQARIEKDEKELEELMASQSPSEAPQEDEEVAEVPEAQDEVKDAVEDAPEDSDEESDEGLSREEKSFKKRYGDLRRHMSEKEKEWKDRMESLEAKIDGSAPFSAPKSADDIKEWATKNPDAAAIVEAIAEKKASEKFAKADERLREIDEARYEVERSKAEDNIRKTHSDFDDLRDSDSFHDWVGEQPKWVQDALYENADDAASVVRVIDLYKADNGLTPTAKKAKTKDAAKAVSKGGRTKVDDDGSASMVKESDVSKMSDQEFSDNYDRILEAQRTGKFIYDMSGRAR
jgi:hypothetical protein